MKRTSAITQLLTVLLLAGCSQNEVTDVNPDSHPAVGFGVYTGLATRGVDMTTESMKDSPRMQRNTVASALWDILRGRRRSIM